MQAPLILEVPKVGKGQTAGWPVHLCPSHALGGKGCLGVLSNPMLPGLSPVGKGNHGLSLMSEDASLKGQQTTSQQELGWTVYGPFYPPHT